MKLIAAIVCGLLFTAAPLLAAPLSAVEATLDEKEQLIRLQAQGPLPYEVEQKTPTRLVVFLPRAQIGAAPVFLSLPTGDLSFEENSVGLRLRLENISGPVKIAVGKRPGSLEIRVALQTPEEKPAASNAQQPASGGLQTTTAQPTIRDLSGGIMPITSTPSTRLNQSQTANPAIPSTSNTPKVGDVSDQAEEDPDPPRPGVTPVPPRPLPQP